MPYIDTPFVLIYNEEKRMGCRYMAENKTYPTFSSTNWWKLREKFRASFPRTAITEEYLSSILGMKQASVRNNGLITNLKALGLIDDDAKCTDLANRWRMDETYTDVCKEIREKVYPPELIDIGIDRQAVNSWFMTKSGGGESLAGKLTSLYLLLSTPEIKKPDEKKDIKTVSPKTRKAKSQQNGSTVEDEDTTGFSGKPTSNMVSPSVNLNLQIHISANATPQQIDQIFSSMAKHLYGRE